MTKQLTKLFELCPYNAQSVFEMENFYAQSGVSHARYIIEVVNKIRKIESDLLTETRQFETKCLEEEKQTLEKILLDQDISELESKISNWEMMERDHWADHLGKIAAIEILTYGKPAVATLTKMAKLPEDLYIKSTQICVRLANAIKEATVRAEQEIGIGEEEDYADAGLPSDDSSVPSTLILKKVKQ
jgi:hypothetical protein